MIERISEAAITGILQEVGEQCQQFVFDHANGEAHFTEENIGDWRAVYHDLHAIFTKLQNLAERSKEPDPMPAEYLEYTGPEYRPLSF